MRREAPRTVTGRASCLPGGARTTGGFGKCRKHFGNAPTVAAAAERERIEGHARTQLARLEVRPVDNPLEELQKLAGRVLACKQAIGELVNGLSEIRYVSTAASSSARRSRSSSGPWTAASGSWCHGPAAPDGGRAGAPDHPGKRQLADGSTG